MSANKFKRLYNEGDGIKFFSTEHAHLRFNIRLVDIWQRHVAIFESISEDFSHLDYFSAVGRTRNPIKYGPIYEAYLDFLYSYPEQMLRVLCAYYQQYAEYLNSKIETLKATIDINLERENECPVTFIKSKMEGEMQSDNLFEFVQYVDEQYEFSLFNTFREWHQPNIPLIILEQLKCNILYFKEAFPISYSMLMQIVTPTRSRAIFPCNIGRNILKFSLSLCRKQCKRFLSHWEMACSVSNIARGCSRSFHNESVNNDYALSNQTTLQQLSAVKNNVMENMRKLVLSEVCVITAFDSFQKIIPQKFQRNAKSSEDWRGTC